MMIATLALVCALQADDASQTPDERAELLAAIERFGTALTERDPELFERAVDLDGLIELADQLLPEPSLQIPAQRRAFKLRFAAEALGQGFDLWEQLELRHVHTLASGDRSATCRMRGNGFHNYVRFFLRRGQDGFRVIDQEDLDVGMRMSHVVAMALAEPEVSKDWASFVEAFARLLQALEDHDLDSAQEALARMAGLEVPDEFRALYWLHVSTIAQLEERWDDSLVALERVVELRDDLPLVELQRAAAYIGNGEFEQALAAAQRYEEELGADAEVLDLVGRAYAGLGRDVEARDAFRRGLADDPQNLDDVIGFARLAGADQEAALRDAYERVEDLPDRIDAIAEGLLETESRYGLELLVDVLAELAPEDPNVGYYGAVTLELAGDVEAACPLLAEAISRVPELEERSYYVSYLVDLCEQLGRPLFAYELSPDKPLAFDTLGMRLVEAEDVPGLHELVVLHAGVAPDDPWLPYYRGQLESLNGVLHKAASEFERGWRASEDPEIREEYRWAWVGALYEMGAGVRAYRDVPPREETMEQLLGNAFFEANSTFLLELAGEVGIRISEAEALKGICAFYAGDYPGALSLEAVLAKLDPEGPLLPEAELALILSAFRSGRSDLALEQARRSTRRDGDPYFEVFAHALRGEAPAAIAALEACVLLGYEPEDFFDDPDVGPLLRLAPEYAALRERWNIR